MFSKRCDGVEVRDMGVIEQATAYFMPMRIDAVNKYTNTIDCAPIDEFIKQQRQNGVHYTYNDIFVASVVRILYERPKLNRFINRCVVYQRNDICISMAVKKDLQDDGEEMTLKFHFKGTETLPEVKKIVDDEISKHLGYKQIDQSTVNAAGKLNHLPHFLFRWALAFVRFLDRHNMLSRSLIEASPFHTSLFMANLKSIKLGKVYHHLYNFGTTTIFATLSKEEFRPVANRFGEVSPQKVCDIGLSLDERVCDGLYFSHSLKLWTKLLSNPNMLFERPAERVFDLSKKFDREYKKSLEKEQKYQQNLRAKEARSHSKKVEKYDKKQQKLLKKQAKVVGID